MAVAFDQVNFRVALARAGYRSVAQLARAAEFSPSFLRQVARGLVPSDETRMRIASMLKVDSTLLWRAPPASE